MLTLLFLLLDVLENHGQVVHDILLAALFDPEDLGALIEQLAGEADVD